LSEGVTMPHDRRRILQLLAGGLGAAGLGGVIARALAAGDLPTTAGIVRLEGTATVNGRDARVGTPVAVGDRVATGVRSQAVVVHKGDAFLMRANSVIEIRGREQTLSELVIASGRVLSVFMKKKPVAVKAGTATIGI